MRLETQGDVDGAIAAYEELYKRRSDSALIANNLASLLAEHRADKPEELERAVLIAQRFKDAGNPYMQDTYGWILHLQGKSEAAVPPLRSAAEKLTTNGVVQYHAGLVHEKLGQNDRAFDYLTRAVAIADEADYPNSDRARAALKRVEAIRASQTREGAKAGAATPQQ